MHVGNTASHVKFAMKQHAYIVVVHVAFARERAVVCISNTATIVNFHYAAIIKYQSVLGEINTILGNMSLHRRNIILYTVCIKIMKYNFVVNKFI